MVNSEPPKRLEGRIDIASEAPFFWNPCTFRRQACARDTVGLLFPALPTAVPLWAALSGIGTSLGAGLSLAVPAGTVSLFGRFALDQARAGRANVSATPVSVKLTGQCPGCRSARPGISVAAFRHR